MAVIDGVWQLLGQPTWGPRCPLCVEPSINAIMCALCSESVEHQKERIGKMKHFRCWASKRKGE
jgi:hypothetical protein